MPKHGARCTSCGAFVSSPDVLRFHDCDVYEELKTRPRYFGVDLSEMALAFGTRPRFEFFDVIRSRSVYFEWDIGGSTPPLRRIDRQRYRVGLDG